MPFVDFFSGHCRSSGLKYFVSTGSLFKVNSHGTDEIVRIFNIKIKM